MKRIGIDIDGVIGDIFGAAQKAALEKFGVDIRYEDVTEHGLSKCTALAEWQEKEIFQDPDLYENMELIPGAREALLTLTFLGWDIWLITSRRFKNASPITWGWLRDKGIPFQFFHLESYMPKVKSAKLQEFSFFIEDRYSTALELSTVVDVIMMAHPWNDRPLNGCIARLDGWDEIGKHLGVEMDKEYEKQYPGLGSLHRAATE